MMEESTYLRPMTVQPDGSSSQRGLLHRFWPSLGCEGWFARASLFIEGTGRDDDVDVRMEVEAPGMGVQNGNRTGLAA